MEVLKIILKILYYSIDIIIMAYFLYYFVTGLFVFKKSKVKNKIRKYKPTKKMAVLIAARNESSVIGHLLESLNKQDYPKDLYDVFVIPNNCTDNTEEVAREKGAKIINCTIPVKAKGDVLKFTFNFMLNNHPEYEAYCIFDADNIVHPKFLRRMNDALCSGFRVAQCNRDTKNPSDSWVSSCYSLFYLVQNFFFNEARMKMGWSSSINGTGFVISRDVIKERGFSTVTMTEDIEFAAQCALNNERIAYVKEAITYDEQPLSFSASWKQRKRWSVGTIQCMNKYSGKLIKTWLKEGIPQAFDMGLFFLAPIIQVVTFVVIFMLFMYNLLGLNVSDVIKFAYNNKMVSMALAYICTVGTAALVVMLEKKGFAKTFKGIFTLAIFMVSWIPINIICMVKRDCKWEPIKHDRVVDIDSILNKEK